jgi:hypothetical protein
MPILRRAAGFLCRFIFIYGLLIAPWPGWNATYAKWFRAFNKTVFAPNEKRYLLIEATQGAPAPLDTRITLANRQKTDLRGNLAGKKLALDSRGIGWVPTALFIALVLASPVGWRRRIWALLWGLLLVHGYIAFSVGCNIWNQSTDLGLVTLTPFWKAVAGGLEETLVTQLGASFVVPTLVWLAVTFRIRDLECMDSPGGAGATPASGRG